MQKPEKSPAPIWVKNPETGKEINVEPLFRLMNEHYNSVSKNADELRCHVDTVIQYVANETVPEWLHSADAVTLFRNQTKAFNSLYRLRETFEEMEERQTS